MIRPQGGQLLAVKTRAHARHHVMPRDVVAAECPKRAAGKMRERGTAWFAGDEKSSGARCQRKQPRQSLMRHVMQKQIDYHEVDHALHPLQKIEHFGYHRFCTKMQ